MVFYISHKDYQIIKMKSNYREFSLVYGNTIPIKNLYKILDIEINHTIFLIHYSGNITNTLLYPKTANIDLLSNWTTEEYVQFTNLLKTHSNINGLNNKLKQISNELDNHTYDECVIFFKYIRNSIEQHHSKMNQLCIPSTILDKYSHYLYFTNHSNSNIIFVDISNTNIDYLKNNNIEINNCLILFYGIDKLLYQSIKPENIYILLNDILRDLQLENILKKKILFMDSNFNWAFSIRDIAKYYNAFFNLTVEETIEYLWGDFYYNETNLLWYNTKQENIKRAFCNYILIPLKKIIHSIEQNDINHIQTILLKYNISLENIVLDNITFDSIMTINFPFNSFFIKFLNLS